MRRGAVNDPHGSAWRCVAGAAKADLPLPPPPHPCYLADVRPRMNPARKESAMLHTLKKLAYGARVAMSRSGELSQIDVAGLSTQVRSGGDGPPFFYLHSALGETIWLPFLEAWSKQ